MKKKTDIKSESDSESEKSESEFFIVIVQSSTTKFELAALERVKKNNNNRNEKVQKTLKDIKKTVQFGGEQVYLQD